MSDDVSSSESPAAPREEMISTAVRFLQNPKVTQSPPTQKRTFLEKKGLTTEEIDVAMARVGVVEGDTPVPVAPVPGGAAVQPPGMYVAGYQPGLPPHAQPGPVSTWSRFRDTTATAIVVAGLAYGLYKFYKKYIMPIWFGPSPEERQLTAMHKSITELEASIKDMLKSMQDIQGSLTTQQSKIEDISSSNTRPISTSEEHTFVKDVKDEIKSLKGLLLGRKQFPPTPASQPVLPAWQLAAQKTDDKPATDSDNTGTKALSTPTGSNTITTQPAATEVITTPSATEVITTPSATEVITTPSATEVITTPSATDVIATPSATEVITTPSATEVITTPSATDVIATPSTTEVVTPPEVPVPAQTETVPAVGLPVGNLETGVTAGVLTEATQLQNNLVLVNGDLPNGLEELSDTHSDDSNTVTTNHSSHLSEDLQKTEQSLCAKPTPSPASQHTQDAISS